MRTLPDSTPLKIVVETMEQSLVNPLLSADSKELSHISLPVPSAETAALSKQAAATYAKGGSKENLCKNLFEAVLTCLEPTASVQNVSVSIPSTMNAIIATNGSNMDPSKRLNIVVGSEVALFVVMSLAHVIQMRCKENAPNVVKTLLKNVSIVSNVLGFTYDTACRIATLAGMTNVQNTAAINAVLGTLIGASFGLGLLVCAGVNKEPDSKAHKTANAFFYGVLTANTVSNIGRMWRFFPTSNNSYTQQTNVSFDYAAIVSGAAAGITSWFYTPNNKKAQYFAGVCNLMNNLGTCFEALDFDAVIANFLLASKGIGLLSFALLNNRCAPKIDNKADLMSPKPT